jgi:predicted TIM-barrel enzyme
MGRRFTREEILGRLRKTSEEGKPIIAAGSSAGIIAKCAELGGADLIMVYSSGKARIRGFQTTMVENSNAVTLEMFEEINNVVQDTPIIAGIDSTEPPAGRDLAELVQRFVDTGFSGIINFPTYGFFEDETWRKDREIQGIGFSSEIELIRVARNMDVFTMAYVFFPQDARAMAEAGVDCMVPHAGGTAGGLVGFDAIASPLKDAAATVQKMLQLPRIPGIFMNIQRQQVLSGPQA